jgi:hypothetical protein
MMIQPAIFLRRVHDDFHLAGGRTVIRDFRAVDDVLALPEKVVFNCTGPGAAALFGDQGLRPARGARFPRGPDAAGVQARLPSQVRAHAAPP